MIKCKVCGELISYSFGEVDFGTKLKSTKIALLQNQISDLCDECYLKLKS